MTRRTLADSPALSPRAAALLEAIAAVVETPSSPDRLSGLRVLGTDDVARLLGVSASAVRELARRGKIPMRRVAGSYRILETDYVRWIRGQTPDAEPEPSSSAGGLRDR